MVKKIIAYNTLYSGGKVVIEESTGEGVSSRDVEHLLMWLITDEMTEYRTSAGNFKDEYIRVCWCLDDTLAPLLKLIGKPRCQELDAAGIGWASGAQQSIDCVP